MRATLVVLVLSAAACSPALAEPEDSGSAEVPDAGEPHAGSPDAGVIDKAAGCAATFGDQLTNAFGRVDGTVVAIVEPGNMNCALPNRDHVVVQVQMNGAVYRMVVNVQGSGADPKVSLGLRDGPLPEAWAEGWHTNAQLDYPALGAHSTDFVPHSMAELVPLVTEPIRIGSKISVYSTSSGGAQAASSHLIHRNGNNHDGALVLEADSANPHWLLFRFSNQVF